MRTNNRPHNPRRKTPANTEKLSDAQSVFTDALGDAAVAGFYGEVRVSVTFQDGVVQKVNVENSRVIR